MERARGVQSNVEFNETGDFEILLVTWLNV
jgi:hypothetical protein